MDIDDKCIKYVPLDQLVIPPSGLIEHREGAWWIVHPTFGAMFYKVGRDGYTAPQCNSNEGIARRIREKFYPWADCVQIQHAFYVVDPKWYQNE
jgi:hypothetical protein